MAVQNSSRLRHFLDFPKFIGNFIKCLLPRNPHKLAILFFHWIAKPIRRICFCLKHSAAAADFTFRNRMVWISVHFCYLSIINSHQKAAAVPTIQRTCRLMHFAHRRLLLTFYMKKHECRPIYEVGSSCLTSTFFSFLSNSLLGIITL